MTEPAFRLPETATNPDVIDMELYRQFRVQGLCEGFVKHYEYVVACGNVVQGIAVRERLLNIMPDAHVLTAIGSNAGDTILHINTRPVHAIRPLPPEAFFTPESCTETVAAFWAKFGGWYAATQINQLDFDRYAQKVLRHPVNSPETGGHGLQAELHFDTMMRLLCQALNARDGGTAVLMHEEMEDELEHYPIVHTGNRLEFRGTNCHIFRRKKPEAEYDGVMAVYNDRYKGMCYFDVSTTDDAEERRLKRRKTEKNLSQLFIRDHTQSAVVLNVYLGGQEGPCTYSADFPEVQLNHRGVADAIFEASQPLLQRGEQPYEDFRMRLDALSVRDWEGDPAPPVRRIVRMPGRTQQGQKTMNQIFEQAPGPMAIATAAPLSPTGSSTVNAALFTASTRMSHVVSGRKVL